MHAVFPCSPCGGQRAAGDAAGHLWWGTDVGTAHKPSSPSLLFFLPRLVLYLSCSPLGHCPHCRQQPEHSD